jgi:hypothetical protein
MLGSQAAHGFGVAFATMTEVEIISGDDAGSSEAIDQIALHEIGWFKVCKGTVELESDLKVGAGCGNQPFLEGFGGQAEHRLFGAEKRSRMRFEGENPKASPLSFCGFARNREQRLMAAMHAIKIADRHDSSAHWRRDFIITAENLHQPGKASRKAEVMPSFAMQGKEARRNESQKSGSCGGG